MTTHETTLAAGIDVKRARREFAAKGITRIDGILDQDFARQLYDYLHGLQDWNLVFRDNDRHYDVFPPQWQAMNEQQRTLLTARINALAGIGFQYCFHNVPVYDLAEQGIAMHPLLARLHDCIGAETFARLGQAVTGIADIGFADCQVTRYTAGSFLAPHDDAVHDKHRRAAYVLGLTPQWQAEWGGLLQFLNEHGAVTSTCMPAFNTLTVFRVPQKHLVSYVAPYAQQQRLSVTGWFRASPESQ